MRQANQRLQKFEFLSESQAPAARQTSVVEILPFHSHGLAEHVLGIEDVHQVDQAHLPWPSLFADDGFEGECGGAMAAAGVEIDEIDCRQWRLVACVSISRGRDHQSPFWSGNMTGMCILGRKTSLPKVTFRKLPFRKSSLPK